MDQPSVSSRQRDRSRSPLCLHCGSKILDTTSARSASEATAVISVLSQTESSDSTPMEASGSTPTVNSVSSSTEASGSTLAVSSDSSLTKVSQDNSRSSSSILISGKCRQIDKEAAVFLDGEQLPVDVSRALATAVRSEYMVANVSLRKWVILVPQRVTNLADKLTDMMSSVSVPFCLLLVNPVQIIPVADDRVQSYLRAIDDAMRQCEDLQMVMVIFTRKMPEVYTIIRRILGGIPSVYCLTGQLIFSYLMSTAIRVVMLMRVQLGDESCYQKLPMKNTMVVGIEGYQPDTTPMVGAMVSNTSPSISRYSKLSCMYEDTSQLDLARRVCRDIFKCLYEYKMNSGDYPECVIVYRNGEGDNLPREAYQVELQQIKDGLREFYFLRVEPVPKLIYVVVVAKNVNLGAEQGHSNNPGLRTAVDDIITVPNAYEFCLTSCGSRQDIVPQYSYNVLHDDSGMGVGKMKSLTCEMCCCSSSGDITVPVPCQLARIIFSRTEMRMAEIRNEAEQVALI